MPKQVGQESVESTIERDDDRTVVSSPQADLQVATLLVLVSVHVWSIKKALKALSGDLFR